MKKYYYLLIVFFNLLFSFSFAQKVTLKGEVRNEATNEPIEYANVSILTVNKTLINGTVTDAKGKFLIPNLNGNLLSLKVQFIGFEPQTININIEESNKEILLPLILLKMVSNVLDEVKVTGEKAVNTVQIDKKVISAKQFQNAANGTGLDLLQRIPSITVNTEGEVALRGSSGLIVLINGKPSSRAPADILSQIPANLIEQVEIITTPTAKYDSDGKSGIINIITKQAVDLGWSMITNAMFGGVKPTRFGGDIFANYNAKKWSFYAGADYRRYNFDGYRVGTVRTVYKDTLTLLSSSGVRNYEDYQYSLRTGFSYNPSPNDGFNLGFYFGQKQTDRIANLHYEAFIQTGNSLDLYATNLGNPNRIYFNKNLFVRTGEFQTANIDYFHQFSNRSKISLLGLYEYSVLGGPLNDYDYSESNGELLLHERSDERSPLTAWRLQADYSLPLTNKRKLEMGYQFRTVQHEGTFTYEQLNLQNQTWENNANFSDHLHLRQNIQAGYVQFGKEDKKFAYNFGLRAEYMNRSLTHDLETKTYLFDKLNLFPSVQALWQLNDRQKLRISYNRRIDRPTTKLLSPFKNRRHSEAIEIGDPTLRPEIADVVEVGFSQFWEKITLNITPYYSHIQDKIFRVNDIYSRSILIRSNSNAGSATSIGGEVSAEIKAAAWWKFFVSGNLYQFHVKGNAFGIMTNTSSLNFNSSANTTIDFTKRLKFQWDMTYLSRSVTTQGMDSDLLLSTAGMKYAIWKNKGNLGLTLTNIFNSNIQTITNQTSAFYSSTDYRKYDRVLQISLNYRFNDNNRKTKTTKTDYGEKDF